MTQNPEAPTPGPTGFGDLGRPAMDTYARVLEPGSANRLPLGDGVWHQLSRSYIRVRLISLGLAIVVLAAVVVLLLTLTHAWWPWIPGGAAGIVLLWCVAIAPRQARAYAYQLRDDDLVFRRGILWQRQVAVPYGRMQLVDVTQGPLDRAFGIAQLKLVTAAASSGVAIPGLARPAAEQLRDTLIAVAEKRRTGL
jgi:membrane protein YdbS with pleckstrin-like domain